MRWPDTLRSTGGNLGYGMDTAARHHAPRTEILDTHLDDSIGKGRTDQTFYDRLRQQDGAQLRLRSWSEVHLAPQSHAAPY